MKKIFSSLILVICLVIATIWIGGCSSCSSGNNSENGGQTEVNKITTLEGVWESKHGREGEHEKIVVEGISIKCYIHEGARFDYELRWAGIYIPFTEPISEGEWTFENDNSCEEDRPDISSKTFKYVNGELSCNMQNSLGIFKDITFTKVSN